MSMDNLHRLVRVRMCKCHLELVKINPSLFSLDSACNHSNALRYTFGALFIAANTMHSTN